MRDCRLTIMGLGLTLTITRKSCKLYLARDQSELRQTSTQSSRTFIFNVYLICIPFVSFLKAMPAPIPVWQYSCYPYESRIPIPLTPPPPNTILYFVKASTELKDLWSNCCVEMDGKSKLKLVISALCFCLVGSWSGHNTISKKWQWFSVMSECLLILEKM